MTLPIAHSRLLCAISEVIKEKATAINLFSTQLLAMIHNALIDHG